MVVTNYREDMEHELTWRMNEIVFYKNQLSKITKIDDQEKYCKSLWMMLYSHYEGFVKQCFTSYVDCINEMNLPRKSCNESLVSLSMFEIFKNYDNQDRNCNVFRRKHPDTSTFDKFYRQTDLIIQLNEFMDDKLYIKPHAVNTESNLWYEVLQKNLYRLGLDYDYFKSYESIIKKLVHKRNGIAHGSEKSGIKVTDYNTTEQSIIELMNKMILYLTNALKDMNYLKQASS